MTLVTESPIWQAIERLTDALERDRDIDVATATARDGVNHGS